MNPTDINDDPTNPSTDADSLAKLESLLEDMGAGQMALSMFSLLPDIMFWIKDVEGHLLYCNQAYANAAGLSTQELIGKSDLEVFTPELAKIFMEDDQVVIKKRLFLKNKLELVPQKMRGFHWRQTSKRVLVDQSDKVRGTVGMSRLLMSDQQLPAPYKMVSELVKFIEDNIGKSITVNELCEQYQVSQSTLERRFKEHFGCSPKRFIMQTKLQKACSLLVDSPMPIRAISSALGYENQASFARVFTSELGMSPTKYREAYQA